MPAPKPRTAGERLRHAADQLYGLAERADTETRSLGARQHLHDEIETVAGDVRAVAVETGDLIGSQLVLGVGHTLDSIRAGLRDKGITFQG